LSAFTANGWENYRPLLMLPQWYEEWV
jgi:hypothetical protein